MPDAKKHKRLNIQIEISLDGNQWCALMGIDLQEGIAGFGDTPQEAVEDLSRKSVFAKFLVEGLSSA